MGEPMKMVDLARDMTRLSGFEPDVDIPIVLTGTRPGERLFEELRTDGENVERTSAYFFGPCRPGISADAGH